MADAAVGVWLGIEDGQAAYDLLSYVGDHGGGERYPNGDCPAEQPCPQCDANRLAAVLKRALDGADPGSATAVHQDDERSRRTT